MDITEEFTAILKKDKEGVIIPFLKTLDKKQKREFVPGLKKLHKYYSDYVYVDTSGLKSGSARWTANQRMILSTAAFLCYNQKDFAQSQSYGIINRNSLNEILPWYCPDWFNDYINNYANENFVPYFLSYDWYMELIEKGYIKEHPGLIAKILPQSIFTPLNRGYDYNPENLLKREITLNEHIWYLFSYENTINWSDRYVGVSEKSKDGLWIDTFKKYVDEGKLDRQRVLKETLSASNKSFNQTLSGWFTELFIQLDPSKNELIRLQDELLNTLNSPHSKVVNISLKYLKEIAPAPEFAFDAFLDHAPLVLTSETKTAVSSALMILDKLAKKHHERKEEICVTSCQALIHEDEQLQIRAAKLIHKYGDVSSSVIKETLANYFDALFLEPRNLLSAYLETANAEAANIAEEIHQEKTILSEIAVPETLDDLVFLASQAFDQNETYHFDLLPAALLKFQGEMTAANILKLMPAFQRAYKIVTGDWHGARGFLDDMLAIFFIDYGQLLIKFYPEEAGPIRQMNELFRDSEQEKKYKWSGYGIRINSGIRAWSVFTKSSGYKPYKHILLSAFFLLERKMELPLLSTPTHAPCRVSSVALIERLFRYQEAKIIPGDMDFQVAVARCMKDNREEALNFANGKLKGEYRLLISFLFGGDYQPTDSYKLKNTWLVTSLTTGKKELAKRWFSYSGLSDQYLLADFEWSSKVEHYTYKQYDYALKKNIQVPGTRKVIEIKFGDKQKKPSAIKGLLNAILPNQKELELSLYDFTELKYEYILSEHNDIKRLIYLNPAHPELLLAHIIHKGLRSPDFSGENEKKLIINTLEALLALNSVYGKMGHLLIASCMISSDKTVRNYAAELWIKGVSENTLQSEQIGEIIGIHEKIELAPLKRFTDLAISNMCNISKKHNIQLQKLITACICNMADKPVNNTKKLLDIYAEILSLNKTSKLDTLVLAKFDFWRQNEALTKSIDKILKQIV